MPHLKTIPVGIVVAREDVDQVWQVARWRALSVFMDAPPQSGPWREVLRGDGYVHYHAATLLLELRRSEVTSYQINLANGEPSVYIVMHEAEDGDQGGSPVVPHLVTASPFEAQAHGESGFERVDRVAMPDELIALVEAFIKDSQAEPGPLRSKPNDGKGEQDGHFANKPVFSMGDGRMRDRKTSRSDDE
ncbi:MAG: DUF3305 domain-containing protein [Hyphomicrobiaceae bacterium]